MKAYLCSEVVCNFCLKQQVVFFVCAMLSLCSWPLRGPVTLLASRVDGVNPCRSVVPTQFSCTSRTAQRYSLAASGPAACYTWRLVAGMLSVYVAMLQMRLWHIAYGPVPATPTHVGLWMRLYPMATLCQLAHLHVWHVAA
jgi:hypothetical protein